MKKNLFFFLMLFVALSTTFTSCKDDEEEDTTKNIVELAQGNSDLSSLVAAVQRAGLVEALSDESKQYTVFAPTNAAFAAFLTANGYANLDAVPEAALKNLLLNHVLGTEVKAAAVTTGYVKTLATFSTTTSNISMYLSTASGVKINGGPTVINADVDANNGVVHVVDAVIGIPVVPTFAVVNPNFSTLVAALTRNTTANYVGTLSGAGPFTVFAPTNAAFEDLLEELGKNSLTDFSDSELDEILTYHVVAGANVLAGSLTEGQVVTTLETGTFTISLVGGAKITDDNNRVSNIITTDIQGSNGVVHAIDKVLRTDD